MLPLSQYPKLFPGILLLHITEVSTKAFQYLLTNLTTYPQSSFGRMAPKVQVG